VQGEIIVDGGEIGPVARARPFQVPQGGFDGDAPGLPLLAGESREPWSPSSRTSSGSVSPCATSVARITEKVMNTIKFRWGKGTPPGRLCGSASAAASAITPRIPVQPTTTSCRAG